MKIKWNEKYTTIAIYALIVIILSISFNQITSNIPSFRSRLNDLARVLNPFFIGMVLAYLLNFLLDIYEERLLKNLRPLEGSKKLRRTFGLVLTYLTGFFLLAIFYSFIMPQLISSVSGLVNNIPEYIDGTTKIIVDINNRLALNEEYSDLLVLKWNEMINQGIGFTRNTVIPVFANFIKNIISSIWNVVLGIIVSIYILTDKEMFIGLSKKVTWSIFPGERAQWLIEITRRADKIFSRFIVGKILDSLIIGAMTFVILKLVNMPFAILVSFIVGLTNIIPFFGPFIGAIPSVVIIFFESPIKALWFILIIIIIQQIDGNIIGPKILGDSLGISAFWILFSLLIGGKFFGFMGMVLGVPVFTLVYSILRDLIDRRLRAKGRSWDLKDYMDK